MVSDVRAAVAAVPDPEMPMLTLADLGVLRSVEVSGSTAVVTLTPTYSGCPAMAEIKADVRATVEALGLRAEIRTRLSPPWSSDWITPAGRAALAEAGVAPPGPAGTVSLGLPAVLPVHATCPRCGSIDTRLTSAFGPTACTTLHTCSACGEPFEKVREQ
ncbi:phenylacetate-CoA oxygenase subunit PaaJ [Nocardioides marmoribigeumensis]